MEFLAFLEPRSQYAAWLQHSVTSQPAQAANGREVLRARSEYLAKFSELLTETRETSRSSVTARLRGTAGAQSEQVAWQLCDAKIGASSFSRALATD